MIISQKSLKEKIQSVRLARESFDHLSLKTPRITLDEKEKIFIETYYKPHLRALKVIRKLKQNVQTV